MKQNTKSKKKVVKECESCGFDDIKKKASWECPECGSCSCNKCYDKYMGECWQCPPPSLIKLIK